MDLQWKDKGAFEVISPVDFLICLLGCWCTNKSYQLEAYMSK